MYKEFYIVGSSAMIQITQYMWWSQTCKQTYRITFGFIYFLNNVHFDLSKDWFSITVAPRHLQITDSFNPLSLILHRFYGNSLHMFHNLIQ